MRSRSLDRRSPIADGRAGEGHGFGAKGQCALKDGLRGLPLRGVWSLVARRRSSRSRDAIQHRGKLGRRVGRGHGLDSSGVSAAPSLSSSSSGTVFAAPSAACTASSTVLRRPLKSSRQSPDPHPHSRRPCAPDSVAPGSDSGPWTGRRACAVRSRLPLTPVLAFGRDAIQLGQRDDRCLSGEMQERDADHRIPGLKCSAGSREVLRARPAFACGDIPRCYCDSRRVLAGTRVRIAGGHPETEQTLAACGPCEAGRGDDGGLPCARTLAHRRGAGQV